MNLSKYWRFAQATIDETLTYRLNFLIWRVRIDFQLITLYYLWLSLLPTGKVLFGYDQQLMLSYIFGATLIGSIVFSTRAGGVGEEINSGNLSNYLLRPMNYFFMWAGRDVGDKIMNIGCSIIELTIFFLILKPPFFIQANLFLIFLTIFSVLLATILYFIFQLLLGSIGFWSNEIWAPRFIFTILLQFFSGGLFPLDILPKPILNIFELTPFPYMLYFPLKLYLGQLQTFQIIQGTCVTIIWIILSYFILKYIWNLGLKNYTAQGR